MGIPSEFNPKTGEKVIPGEPSEPSRPQPNERVIPRTYTPTAAEKVFAMAQLPPGLFHPSKTLLAIKEGIKSTGPSPYQVMTTAREMQQQLPVMEAGELLPEQKKKLQDMKLKMYAPGGLKEDIKEMFEDIKPMFGETRE